MIPIGACFPGLYSHRYWTFEMLPFLDILFDPHIVRQSWRRREARLRDDHGAQRHERINSFISPA